MGPSGNSALSQVKLRICSADEFGVVSGANDGRSGGDRGAKRGENTFSTSGVERRRGLIGENDARPMNQRASDRGSLRLPS
jgi:hypothetical protein